MSDGLKFSVVVPTCERPESLRRCLEQLRPEVQSIPPGSYEVIVTDDSRDTRSCELVRRMFPHFCWTPGPRRGPAANRNHGARSAKGEWIAFIDDDCIPSSAWLAAFARQSHRARALEGRTICPKKSRHPLEERIENTGGGVFWSCNIAMEASLYRATGGFDEDFGEAAFEDMEFFERLKCAGVQPLFVPEATVEHPARILTLKQWWARSLRIRWYSLYLLKVRPGAIQQNGATALVSVLVERSANLLRTVLRQSREFQSAEWLRSAFLPLWELASFPLLLPWVLYWEVRFRRLLRNNRAERLLANDRAQPLSSEA